MSQDQEHEWIFETLADPHNGYRAGSGWSSCGSGFVMTASIRDHLEGESSPEGGRVGGWRIAQAYEENGEMVIVVAAIDPSVPPRRFRRKL